VNDSVNGDIRSNLHDGKSSIAKVKTFLRNLFQSHEVLLVDQKRQVLGVVTNVSPDTENVVVLHEFLNDSLTKFLTRHNDDDKSLLLCDELNNLIFMSFTKDDDLAYVSKEMSHKKRLEYYLSRLNARQNFTFYDLQLAAYFLQGESLFCRANGKYLSFGDHITLNSKTLSQFTSQPLIKKP
jgi:hypothetical protein